MDWSIPRRPALRPAAFIEPCIPMPADQAPAGPAWLHEIKHDGYRRGDLFEKRRKLMDGMGELLRKREG